MLVVLLAPSCDRGLCKPVGDDMCLYAICCLHLLLHVVLQ
jgi:hypothetical protein